MPDRRHLLQWIAASAAAPMLAACTPSKPPFHSLDITGATYGQDMRLPDDDGKPRRIADFRGQVVVVFFGYTMCPDVCPATLLEWSQVKKLLGEQGARLQVLFVTVDPARDTPSVIRQYAQAFDGSFIGLIPADAKQLADTARDFNVYYRKVDGPTPTSYTMDHTAASYVYDPQGRLRLATQPGEDPRDIAADVRRLLNGE